MDGNKQTSTMSTFNLFDVLSFRWRKGEVGPCDGDVDGEVDEKNPSLFGLWPPTTGGVRRFFAASAAAFRSPGSLYGSNLTGCMGY